MSNIIFDFDGTIADTFAVVVDIFHEIAHSGEPLTPDEIERLRGMSLRRVVRELHISPWKIPFLMMRGRRRMARQMLDIHASPGVQQAVRALHTQGHAMYIVSSNSAANIQLFLKRHEIDNEFVKVYGNVGLLDKGSVLKRVMRRNRLKRSDTFYIGDEVRDIEAAQRAGVKIAAVTWGYNNRDVIASHQPDYVVDTAEDLLKLFAK